LNGATVKLWNSRIINDSQVGSAANPGEVLGFGKDGILVKCGAGAIEVLEVQKSGGKKMSAKAYVQTLSSAEQSLHFRGPH
jgi:methionyl-tRNA formyltransferase